MSATAPDVVAVVSRVLSRRLHRRGFLVRAALAGSAISVTGWDYLLKPGDAYAAICGPAASCDSGWTAFCCSIHEGVNQCPPGSFAGGWWKADGAAMCGGDARYIIDCQARCRCACPPGSAFCGRQCWNCRPDCAHDACDQRRTCRNVFRYGQCNEHIDCSGPVVCRAVSCTPPWQWEQCSRVAATDNATVAHNATCLPAWGPIQRRYAELGSQASPLGATVRAVERVPGGRRQRFTRGRMYDAADDAPKFLLHGAVLRRYRRLGETGSALGFPITDLVSVPGGTVAWFHHGGLYARSGHRATILRGRIHRAWLRSGGFSGPLGWPVTDQRRIGADAVRVRFERGTITWHRDTRRLVVRTG